MQKKSVKAVISVLVILAVLAAGVFALLKFKDMYHSLHDHMKRSHDDLASDIYYLETKVDALETRVRLIDQDAFKRVKLNYDWTEDNPLIAHALGGLVIDGHLYELANSLEGFQENYAKGIRVFEVDLMLSSDGALVAAHDWGRYGEENPMSLEEFKQGTFLNGCATQLTGVDIIELLRDYPDIYIVTDSKFTDVNTAQLQFNQLVYLAQQKDVTQVLDRIIVQVYNQGMYDLIFDVYPWKSVIYTLYQSPDTWEEVLEFCESRGIGVVTMNYASATEEKVSALREAGIQTYVHTVNDMDVVKQCQDLGVVGFYTDTVSPSDFG